MTTELTRTVRFCLATDGSLDVDAPTSNTFAAWPPMRGLGRYYELEVTCTGQVEEQTGYMINIKAIDQAVRDVAMPLVAQAAQANDPGVSGLMARITQALNQVLPVPVLQVTLQLAPTVRITMEASTMSHVLISQQYDFSAAHRLHAPALSDQANRETFGKCNNPSGHGHNYRVEVTVAAPVSDTAFDVAALDELVDRTIIERYDHKHLNKDTEDFADVNPSAENIARTIHQHLSGQIDSIGAVLHEVKVWETEKTVCTYRG